MYKHDKNRPPSPEEFFRAQFRPLFNEVGLVNLLWGYYDNPPELGDFREGGIVFYVNKVQRRFLVAALKSLGLFTWATEYQETGIRDSSFFSGLGNTERLCRRGALAHPAASAAFQYRGGGYDNWYLGSSAEVYVFGQFQRQNPHYFVEKNREGYWSSSEAMPTKLSKAQAMFWWRV